MTFRVGRKLALDGVSRANWTEPALSDYGSAVAVAEQVTAAHEQSQVEESVWARLERTAAAEAKSARAVAVQMVAEPCPGETVHPEVSDAVYAELEMVEDLA